MLSRHLPRTIPFAVLLLTIGLASSSTAGEPVGVKAAQRLLKGEGKLVLFLAHPTCNLTRSDIDGVKVFTNGSYQVTATYDYLDSDREQGYRTFRFTFDNQGKLIGIADGPGTGFVPPFLASGLVLELIKTQVRNDPKMRQDPLGMQILEVRDGRQALLLLLQYKQKL